ncbi:MAG: hypothetical protein EOO88_01920 [Pedobacter sp.]|nr:MAG: hypothetical protein EOO88_01920 [Pedobacter sp.]
MKTYKIGIIGYGGFGKFLHYWWNRMDLVSVVAISTGPQDHNDYPGVKKYESWDDLLLDQDIDIVSIATPPASHVKMACRALRAGKHVMLEKPVALGLEEAEELLATQLGTGKVVMVDHMLRYNPIVDAFVALGKSEFFGKLRHAEVTNYAQDNGLPIDHWFWDRTVSGGIFVEHGVHFFDIINALSSQKVKKVHGISHFRNAQQQDQVAAMVLYDDGLMANHYHSFSGPGFFERTSIRLMYDLAKVEIHGWIPLSGTMQVLVDGNAMEELQMIPGLRIKGQEDVAGISDVSRPTGWGDHDTVAAIMCGGISYGANKMISADFGLAQEKSAVYGKCVQDILADMILKIENPSHVTKVSLQDALESLSTALQADSEAMRRNDF